MEWKRRGEREEERRGGEEKRRGGEEEGRGGEEGRRGEEVELRCKSRWRRGERQNGQREFATARERETGRTGNVANKKMGDLENGRTHRVLEAQFIAHGVEAIKSESMCSSRCQTYISQISVNSNATHIILSPSSRQNASASLLQSHNSACQVVGSCGDVTL